MSSAAHEHDYGDPATRGRILGVAWEALTEQGAGLRLQEVAKRAGVSRQALYLHFGDRSGLILALVRHMDETLELHRRLDYVYAAETGEQLIERAMRLNTEFWAEVAPVASVLIDGREDALRSAWSDRMSYRYETFRRMAERLDEMGELAASWSAESASQVLFAVTHFDSWRELTGRLDWDDDRYVREMSKVLVRALLD